MDSSQSTVGVSRRGETKPFFRDAFKRSRCPGQNEFRCGKRDAGSACAKSSFLHVDLPSGPKRRARPRKKQERLASVGGHGRDQRVTAEGIEINHPLFFALANDRELAPVVIDAISARLE